MSTLGKVLLFLNLLAAGGLIYVAAQDWAKRQEISGVVLRYELTLQGLPIETSVLADDADATTVVPIEITTPSGVTLTQANKKILDAQFSGATGGETFGPFNAVRSLTEELDRVEKKLIGILQSQQGNDGKLRYLVGGLDANRLFAPGLLMRMAESFAEREALRNLAYPVPPTPELLQTNVEDAQRRLNRKIAALKSAPAPKQLAAAATEIDDLRKAVEKDPADAAAKAKLAALSGEGSPPFTRDDNDRRRRIALFLMLLDPSAAWQKRTMTVTGLQTYQTALNEQVARVTDIARQTERAIESDQASYEREYEQLKRLALDQDLLVVEQQSLVKGLVEMEALDLASRNARQVQLDNLKKELDSLQKTIACVLDQQAEAEKKVFTLQRTVGDTLRGNLELEAKLDQTEQSKP